MSVHYWQAFDFFCSLWEIISQKISHGGIPFQIEVTNKIILVNSIVSINFRGVLRTLSNIRDENFFSRQLIFAKTALSYKFEKVVNTHLKFLDFLWKILNRQRWNRDLFRDPSNICDGAFWVNKCTKFSIRDFFTVNITKSALCCGFGHINWRSLYFLCSGRGFSH